MIAKNHEKIFEAIQSELIAGLDRTGQSGGAYPYALYLGNWMADFSQLCSPDLPNMLIEKLDHPDWARAFCKDAQAFIDGMEKQLSAIVDAALAKASMDRQALSRTLAKVEASPYQDEALLQRYADYLNAVPSGRSTPQPDPKIDKPLVVPPILPPELAQKPKPPTKPRREYEDALSALLRVVAETTEAGSAQAYGESHSDIAVPVAVLTKYMILPLFDDVRGILKSASRWADTAEDDYRKVVEFFESIGFVDKFNGASELAVWLLGLFKFSDPASAVASDAPTSGSAIGAASANGARAAPSFRVTPTRAFVAPPSIAAPAQVVKHIPPNVYSELFAKYFGFYKPYEHLDRFMDAARIAKQVGAAPGQATLDRKRGFMHYRKDHYPSVVTPIASLKGKGPDLDATLWRGLQIAYGRLAALRDADREALPVNEKLLLIGRSFHVLEDYFAHTNFVDRLIYSMQLEHDFHTHPFELKKILLSVASEGAFDTLAADSNLFGNLDCANPKVRSIIEKGATECVKSGFYDTPDTVHSLVHLIEGLVKHALEMEDEQRDAHFDFYEALEKYALNRLEEFEIVPEFSNNDLLTMLDMDRETVFLDEASFAKIADNNPLIASMGDNAKWIMRLINVVFWLILAYHTAKNLKNAYAAVKSALSFFIALMKIVKTLYFTPNVIVRYLKIAFSTLPEPIRDELIALAIEVVKEACRTLASTVFGWVDKIIENRVRYGSHSLMAKDEDTHQGRLYALAEQFGVLIDKVAIEFLFPQPQTQAPDPLEAREVLERLLDGIAYNPLAVDRDALRCEKRGLLTRIKLDDPASTLDSVLKRCAKAFCEEDKRFAEAPGFVWPAMHWHARARSAAAMRTIARLNSDRIVLVVGYDSLYLSDARFELLKPATTIDLIVFKSASTLCLDPPDAVAVRPWTVKFVRDFMSGESIDWADYRLEKLTASPSTGLRCLPDDYRLLADQFIVDYTAIWRSILIVPGTIGDAQWAIAHDRGRITGWV